MLNPTHQRLAATATRLIAAHGREVQLLSRTRSGDQWEPVISEGTPVPIMAVDTVLKGMQQMDTQERADLLRTKKKVFLIDSQVKPEFDMRLRDPGVTGSIDAAEYSITNVVPVAPGNLSIIYKVHCEV